MAFWSDNDNAQNIMKERSQIEDGYEKVRVPRRTFRRDDSIILIELGVEESDEGTISDGVLSLEDLLTESKISSLEVMLSGEADVNSAYLEVHPGAGGTESQDWAEMLLRMYTRWSEKKGYSLEVVEKSQGEDAGIKAVTIEIEGDNGYGWLKGENGVHRLVRISPFDSGAKKAHKFCKCVDLPCGG